MELSNGRTADTASEGLALGDRLDACRAVHIIRQYLEASNDLTIAIGSIETLIKVGRHFGSDCDELFHHPVLNAILQAVDVLRNHQKDVSAPVRRLAQQYLDSLSPAQSPDFQFRYLIKCVLSGVSLGLEGSPLNDTFSAIVFDTASIILSHCNYNILECVAFLDASQLDWYICRYIVQSILLQHPAFSAVAANSTGTTLYSVLDTKTALQRLEEICPPYEETSSISRSELLVYCVLDAAHRLLVRCDSLPPKGYLVLAESTLDIGSNVLDFKAKTIFCALENSVNILLGKYTLGTLPFTSADVDMAFGLRSASGRLVSKNHSRQNFESNVRESFKRKFEFGRQISSHSLKHRDAIHLEIIKLQDLLTTRKLSLPGRVRQYFLENDLEPLICPISQRPMTEAVYLRCGKTVNLAALEELIAGNIPESHCCCDEIHIDIEHRLHDYPLVSDLSMHHLSRVLSAADVVRYGDLPTLRHLLPKLKEVDKVELLHASLKNVAILTFLLNSGVDANARKDGMTALMIASSSGSIDSVVTLLHFGAEPGARDPSGVSPIMFALRNGKKAVAETLLAKMAGIPIDLLLSGDADIPPENVARSATGLHDFYLGLKAVDKEDSMHYLQRAMELDPENHLYAEEMQVYLDGQERRASARTYVKTAGDPSLYHANLDDEGNLYEGFVLNGLRSGPGKLTYSTNPKLESFDGEWVENAKKTGLLTYRDGSQYHGSLSPGDRRHGQGILYPPNGAWYEGPWEHDAMHGENGKYCFENGDVYEGSFRRDTLEGHGKLIHSNGDFYEGMWKNGLKHGFGTYELESVGLRYEGFWVNDKKHGSGWILYPDGSEFRGEFADDEPVEDSREEPDERRRSVDSHVRPSTVHHSGERSTTLSPTTSTSTSSTAADRHTKHERSRSFVETVGRRIKN